MVCARLQGSISADNSSLAQVSGIDRIARVGGTIFHDADSAVDRELWESDETLRRAERTPAEEANHLKRRKELWETPIVSALPTPPPTGAWERDGIE
jgi:hypothetical protein